MSVAACILAAGEGTRMKSATSKVLHPLLGYPLIWWAVRAAQEAGVDRIVLVAGRNKAALEELFADDSSITLVEQTERLGTGHAVSVALEALKGELGDGDSIVVSYGDGPLIRANTIKKLVETQRRSKAAATVLAMTPPDCSGYGRLVVAGDEIVQIIEDKDCNEQQRAELKLCNSGIYAFDAKALIEHCPEIQPNNVQGEYYITDMVEILRGHQLISTQLLAEDYLECLGVNSRAQLADATRYMRDRIAAYWMEQGVSIMDPNLIWIGPEVTIGQDSEILPMTMIMGKTSIGSNCLIGPNTRLTNVQIADRCIVDETIALNSVLEEGATTGPRAYLRPGTHLLCKAKAGTHVEIKNSTIGEGSKVPHLSYIGDTTMGSGVNIGAGSITCNYDGSKKHPTTIGDDVFVGSDTMMVAPVTIGDGSVIGAGSTITRDVPAGALGITRPDQNNIEGWAKRRKEH